MRITNFDHFKIDPLRKQALLIADAAYTAIDPELVIAEQVDYDEKSTVLKIQGNTFKLKDYKKITCIGFGKAAFLSVKALQQKLGKIISCGFVIDLVGGDLGNITCKIGTHPFPTEVNVAATLELLKLVENSDKDDLVIFVVSGGGSSLLCYPNDITCDIETNIVTQLTKQGASIQELNTVRKHISKVKGGNLAKLCYPATVLSLILSDVPGNDLGIVSSGPTVKDTTTSGDAAAVLKQYNILELCNMPSCSLIETPKEDKYFEKVHNILLLSPEYAVEAMRLAAIDLGWKTQIYSSQYQGNATEVTRDIFKQAKPNMCLIGAGESTVQIKGHGLEGRCQVMALSALEYIQPDQVFLPLASDGFDHSDAAGAIVDTQTKVKADKLGLTAEHYLENNDSYHFFEATEDLVFTGKTGSNVSDFFVLLTN
ncbi:MAG: DUF4147 domain-containing protein [Candidatus Doudnabacteria bacterium]|nr:DUF4147 domain-containing protein [Candidatus Doudnabacteria bacterium]